MERRILHIDMDAFFASVEVVRDPSLRGKPLIIGGEKEDSRGVVSTASYEARRFGVHSAMPLAQARKLCPHGIFMRGHFELYRAASAKVREILLQVSPQVQMASIDEAYIDVSGSQKLFGGDDAIAAFLKETIRNETQLPCTIAISANKLISKVGSDLAKPDGYLRVTSGEEAAFLAPLPVRKLPGAGPKTCKTLESLGVQTLGQLASLPQQLLETVFGPQSAIGLQRAARGISDSQVVCGAPPKSISRETTFQEDLLDWRRLERVIFHLMERCTYALREAAMEARCVTLKARYTDFDTRTFSRTLPEATCVDREVLEALRTLLPKARERRARVRLVGVGLSNLRNNQHQLHLFGRADAEKWERAFEGVDAIRRKLGFEAVRTANSLEPRDQT